MLQENNKRKSLNQMTEEERQAYWNNYRKLVGNGAESQLEAQGESFIVEGCVSTLKYKITS